MPTPSLLPTKAMAEHLTDLAAGLPSASSFLVIEAPTPGVYTIVVSVDGVVLPQISNVTILAGELQLPRTVIARANGDQAGIAAGGLLALNLEGRDRLGNFADLPAYLQVQQKS